MLYLKMKQSADGFYCQFVLRVHSSNLCVSQVHTAEQVAKLIYDA